MGRKVWRLWLGAAAVTAALVGAGPGGASRAGAAERPVVVELFTSQGCSSCPPADALLRDLATRPGVLALGFHIDYWDNLGWKDPFSTPASTDRQRAYARQFNRSQVYTPQLVIEGTDEFVGSDRGAIETALRQARPRTEASITISGNAVSIGAGAGSGTVLLARFAKHRTTAVGAGENVHRTADDVDAVESLTRLGDWDGREARFPLTAPAAGEGTAVLVQAKDGHILGAAMVN